MEEKTNIFKKFIGCIRDIRSFSKYIKEGLGRAVLYAFLLMLVIGLVKGAFLGFKFKSYADKAVNEISSSEYDFEIKDGILNILSEPIEINEGSTLIYIDDNISIDKKAELNNITVHVDEYILILKDGVIVESNGIGEQVASFKDFFGSETVTSNDLISIFKMAGNLFMSISIIITLIESIVIYIMNSLLIAGASMLSNVMMKLGLRFSEMFSLAIYAGTLPALLQLVLTIIFPSIYFGYAGIVGTLVFVILILRTIRRDINEGMNIQ